MKKINTLNEIFEKYKVTIVFLFGSQAQNGFELFNGKETNIVSTKGTDLDVGIVLDNFKELSLHEKSIKYGYIYNEISYLVQPFNLDLVFLQDANYLLQYEAIKGINIYKKDEIIFTDYIEEVIKYASEQQFISNLFIKDMREAISNGQVIVEYQPVK